MTGLRSYERDHDHAAKSEFGILLLRLRKRHDETYPAQAKRLGFRAGTIKACSYGTRPPSENLRRRVTEAYPLTTNEIEAALGREPLGHEGA